MNDMSSLIENATFKDLIYNRSAMMILEKPSWNDLLLGKGVWGLPGGYPLFIAFYGGLFVIVLIVVYLGLKKANYK